MEHPHHTIPRPDLATEVVTELINFCWEKMCGAEHVKVARIHGCKDRVQCFIEVRAWPEGEHVKIMHLPDGLSELSELGRAVVFFNAQSFDQFRERRMLFQRCAKRRRLEGTSKHNCVVQRGRRNPQ